jgi:large subunit ribosomal protein L27
MAHRKAGGSTALGRDSNPKYLGVKLYAGQKVAKGQIIVRQRGTKFYPGINVARGADDTLYSVANGIIAFKNTRKVSFTGKKKVVKTVSVI